MEVKLLNEEQAPRPRRQRKNLSKSLNMMMAPSRVETIDLTDKSEFTEEVTYKVKTDISAKHKRQLEKNHLSPIQKNVETQEKKLKTELSLPLNCEDNDQTPRRSQPHRAARFTESYSTIADADPVVLSEDEKKAKEPSQNGECSSNDDESSSDSDLEVIPMSPPKPLPPEEQLEWENKIHSLQKQLENEDIKLLLLMKLKKSQTKKDHKREEINSTVPPHVKISHRPSPPRVAQASPPASDSPTKKLMPRSRDSPRASPLLVKSLNESKTVTPLQSKVHVPPSVREFKNVPKQEPVVLPGKNISIRPIASKTPSNVPNTENLNRANITIHAINTPSGTPKPKSVAAALNSIRNEVSISLVPAPSTSSEKQEPVKKEVNTQANLQQQITTKMLLQKQLKKTLMQIPNPKPPSQRVRLLPNGNSTDFMWLLGLDVVVDYLIKKKSMPIESKEPYLCPQCKTDFTESWKALDQIKGVKKDGRYVCQLCFSESMKKQLRIEHTATLKAAFAKALQQEKEIKRLSQSITSLAEAATSSSHVPAIGQPPVFTQSVQNKAAAATAMPQPTRTEQNSSNLFHANNLNFFQQFSKLTPQQMQTILQNQAFLAGNLQLPPHMLPFSPFINQFPFHMMNKSSTVQGDLQRQYLLDMIPPRSSSQHNRQS